MTVSAFQIKFAVSRVGMKTVTVSGVVLAYTRQEAVFEATRTLRETMDTMDKNENPRFKLLSAITIPKDLKLKLEEKAKESNRSVSNYIVNLIKNDILSPAEK